MGTSNLSRTLHGGGSGRSVTAPRNSGGPRPGPSNGLVRMVPRSTDVAEQVQEMIQSALAWRGLVQMLWMELGRPPVPGFPASRVQQILWGELPPDNGFFAALLGALTSRSRSGSMGALRSLLVHSSPAPDDVLEAWHRAKAEVALSIRSNASVPSGGAPALESAATADPADESGKPCTAADHYLAGVAAGREAGDDVARQWLDRVQLMLESQTDLDSLDTESAFMAALRQLKQRTQSSFRELEERSKTTSAGWLPRATAADMLRRETLPKPELLWAFTAACGLSREDQDKWEAARSRLSKQHPVRRRWQSVPTESISGNGDEFDLVGEADESAA